MNERRTSWRHQICHIYMSFEKVGCCFGWPHLLADIRSLRFCPPQAKKVHLKHLICPPQAKILEVILTDVAILRQISSTIHQNTRTIPLRSRNNAITAIKLCSIRVWVASFFHILHVHRQRRASCDQYCRNIAAIRSIHHLPSTQSLPNWIAIICVCLILIAIQYACSRIEFAHNIDAFSRIDVDRYDKIELYWSLKADVSWIWVHYIM